MDVEEALQLLEGELERIGLVFEDQQRHDGPQWQSIGFALTLYARRHHRAMLLDVAGSVPVVAGMRAGVIVEAVFTFDYIARRPNVRAPLWVADSYRAKIRVIEEQKTFEDAGLDTRFTRAQLEAFLTNAQRELQAMKAQSRAAEQMPDDAPGFTYEADRPWPTIKQMAESDPVLQQMYTQMFHVLSTDAHISAALFLEDSFVPGADGVERLSDELPTGSLPPRLQLGVLLAQLYANAAHVLGGPGTEREAQDLRDAFDALAAKVVSGT